MSVDPKDPGGVPPTDPVDPAPEPEKQVSYETHRKLLSEKKRAADELARVRAELDEKLAAEKKAAEDKLVEQNQWKELHANTAKELEETKSQLNATTTMISNAKKLRTLTKFAPIKQNYLDSNLFNLDSIILNPETGEVDEHSAQKEAERIRASFPDILVQAAVPKVGNTEPIPNNQGSLTMEQYNAMSPEDKIANAAKLEGVPDWMLRSGARVVSQN